MSCDCSSYECLEVLSGGECDPLVVDLVSTFTGVLEMQYEFNGRWYKQPIEVITGDNIILPSVFNESYIHQIKFYDAARHLFNDTCYKLDTMSIVVIGSATNQVPYDIIKEYTYDIVNSPDPDNPNQQSPGTSIIDNRLIGQTVVTVETQGQSYNKDYFSKVSNTVTMNADTVTFAAGTTVVVYYKTTQP